MACLLHPGLLMVSTPTLLRPVAWSAHAIGVLLVLAPLGELAAGVGSLNPGAVPWRFGAAGLLSGALVLPVAGLGLVLAGGVLLEQWRLLRVLAVLVGILMVKVLVLLAIFGLDTLQVRIQVPLEGRRAFDLAAVKAAGSFALEACVLAVLAVQAHRAARHARAAGAGRRGGGGPLVMPSAER